MSADPSLLAAVEEELVAGVAASDVDCLQELYRRHADPVLRLAFQLVGDRDTAEKAATDAFLCLWDHPDAVAAPGVSVRNFLLEQTRRACASGVGLQLSDTGTTPDAAAGEVGPPQASLDDPALSEDERRALELAVQGMNYKEIARLLGQPNAVVMEWLASGLKKLAD